MNLHRFETSMVLPLDLDTVFAFFAEPENLPSITPPWARLSILTPRPIPMRPGSVIDYTVHVHGVPMRWTSIIADFEPPHRFVDVQLRGPYAFWHHQHTFERMREGTRIGDVVTYGMPFGPIGNLVNRLLVRNDIRQIFRHRRIAIREMLGVDSEVPQALLAAC